ncbi:hypothetical protein HanPSC8_Chr11g0497611 [Helianthus annuus]|nr:hypothetical protein HanPSC8_Chr11g0497611 [Helianthus annuus]
MKLVNMIGTLLLLITATTPPISGDMNMETNKLCHGGARMAVCFNDAECTLICVDLRGDTAKGKCVKDAYYNCQCTWKC